jgi:PAS domain S-box-containing protein
LARQVSDVTLRSWDSTEDNAGAPESGQLFRRRLGVVAGYAVAASLWILISDSLLQPDLRDLLLFERNAQTLKGLAFVVISAAGLHWLMRRAARDIAALQAARGRSEQRLDLVFDSIRDHAIVLIDPDGTITDCNRGVAGVLGWDPHELAGMHMSQFYADELTQGVVEEILAKATKRGRHDQDFWHRRKDGSRFWANVALSRLSNASSRTVGFAMVTRDMSERRRAEDILHANEERLKESESRARLMMDSSVDGIIAIDERGIIENFSGAASRIFGYAADEVIGRNVSVLMPEPDRGRHDGYLRHYLETGEKRVIGLGREVQGLKADGTVFPMDLAISEVFYGNGQRRFVGTVRDLTERRGIEEQLRQAQKMEAVGQLTGGLAHDFNNLLSVTLGCAEMLQERTAHDPRAAKLSDTIIEAGRRGAELTNRLLAFSRRQTLEPASVDLSELIAGLRNLLVRTLGEDIEVHTALPKDLPRATVDPAQVENAVLNLAINARDAMSDGGSLTISVDRARLDDDYVHRNPDVNAGDYLLIAVSDTGIGMSKEVQARVFDPFFTTKPLGKGSGLGLSMVYGFAKQSGGHVKIYSEPGIGTTVRLYLPQSTGEARIAVTAPATDQGAPATGRETVLVAEDDALVRGYVTDQLNNLGYQVIAAPDGRSALAVIETDRPIDLLFTDVVMPGGMNGRELAEAALARRPGLKVLFTTGYTEDVMVLRGKLAPGVQILNKPYGRAALARKLRAVLDSATEN